MSAATNEAGVPTIDCQEFHELVMDYRGAYVLHAQEVYERLVKYIDAQSAARITALEAKCDLLSASLKQADAVNRQLVEVLKDALSVIADYLEYEHNGDPWTEDARIMGEMEIDYYGSDGRLDSARAVLAAAGEP